MRAGGAIEPRAACRAATPAFRLRFLALAPDALDEPDLDERREEEEVEEEEDAAAALPLRPAGLVLRAGAAPFRTLSCGVFEPTANRELSTTF